MSYRRNRKLLLFVLFGFFGWGIFHIFFSPSAYKARKNVENVKRIEIGMPKKEVLRIMGLPDNKRLSFLNQIDSMYYYEPPFGASEGIYVQFSTDNTVNKVVDFE